MDPDDGDARALPVAARHPRLPRSCSAREAFEAWGWRIPFLVSLVLLGISVWIRLKLNESPLLPGDEGGGEDVEGAAHASRSREWGNLKIVLLALFGLDGGAGGGVVHGPVLHALLPHADPQGRRADGEPADRRRRCCSATPFFLVFGSLSDRIGRKPIIMAGLLLAALTYFPIFRAITHYANPALAERRSGAPVTVIADPRRLLGAVQSGGHVEVHVAVRRGEGGAGAARRAVLQRARVGRGGPDGRRRRREASIRVGSTVIPSYDATLPGAADAGDGVRRRARRRAQDARAIPRRRTPERDQQADADAAALDPRHLRDDGLRADRGDAGRAVPDRIRYTSMSLPYHIGNGWFGGFLPPIAFAIVAATGEHLLGALVPDRHRGDHARDRRAVRPRDEGRGHHERHAWRARRTTRWW